MIRISALFGALALTCVGALGAAAPGASATTSGTEHVIMTNLTTNENAPTLFQAYGPISATGKDYSITDNRDRVVLPKGNLTLLHHTTSQSQHFDQKNCVFWHHERGDWSIPSGTGAYKHAHGSGTYRATIIGHGCTQGHSDEFSLVIEAVGTISV